MPLMSLTSRHYKRSIKEIINNDLTSPDLNGNESQAFSTNLVQLSNNIEICIFFVLQLIYSINTFISNNIHTSNRKINTLN